MKYLFVVCVNNCGSTLIQRILGTSNNALRHDSEGQFLVPNNLLPNPVYYKCGGVWTERSDIFENTIYYNWPEIKRVWHAEWAKKGNLETNILIEKSPPNVLRTKLLFKEFFESYFIVSIRNPYVMCQSVKEKVVDDKKIVSRCIKHWVTCAYKQQQNMDLPNSLTVTYEQLCENPQNFRYELIELLPELYDIDLEKEYVIKDKSSKIINSNKEYLKRLTDEDRIEINNTLIGHEEILEFWGYTIREA